MAIRQKTNPPLGDADLLRAVLKQLETLNQQVGIIVGRLSANGGREGDTELSTERDPGDAVPEGVAPTTPAPLTADDKKAKAALDRLPARGRRTPKLG